jgi:hypothetical protein
MLGDIGLTRVHAPLGWGIAFAQGVIGDGWSPYEHAFIDIGGGRIIEARPGGAAEALLSKYDHRPMAWISCPDECREKVAQAARDLIGTPYSYLDYLALGALHTHIPAPHLRAFVTSTGHMICSQFDDEAARRGGWQLFDDGRLCQDVTPGDLYLLSLKLNGAAG